MLDARDSHSLQHPTKIPTRRGRADRREDSSADTFPLYTNPLKSDSPKLLSVMDSNSAESSSRRALSVSPVGHKSSSSSIAYSPPYPQAFLPLHPTTSNSTIHAAGSSLEEDRRIAQSTSPRSTMTFVNDQLTGSPLSRVETLGPDTYTDGAELSRAATAPNWERQQPAPSPVRFRRVENSSSRPSSSSGIVTPSALSSSPQTSARTDRARPTSMGGASTPSRRPARLRSQSSAQVASGGQFSSARIVPLSTPPINRPASTPSPAPPTQSLQSHMYTAGLMNGTLADVHIVAFGHFYRLHRIVLSGQSGFFTSLLSGGFSEDRRGPRRGSGIGLDSEVIAVEMDRPLSRAAFEFVLSRLYGGGPELVPPPWCKTSAKAPLSEPWEQLMLTANGKVPKSPRPGAERDFADAVQSSANETDSEWSNAMAPTVQLATPTFLLSLLATATYLEVPSIQALAMHWIQRTITPWTVAQYLGFSLGRGLGKGSASPELDAPCRGLETVGSPYELQVHSSRASTVDESIVSNTPSLASSISGDDDAKGPTLSATDDEEEQELHGRGHIETEEELESSVFVGPEGERVGEACACWLAKWGADILATEEWIERQIDDTFSELSTLASTDEDDVHVRRRLVEPFFYVERRPECFDSNPEFAPPSLHVWSSLGGLDSRWVRGIISSDAFFLAPTLSGGTTKLEGDLAPAGLESDGEFQRYLFAKRVVDLRRKEALRQAVLHERRKRSSALTMVSTLTSTTNASEDEALSSLVAKQMDLGVGEESESGRSQSLPEAEQETSDEGKCVGERSSGDSIRKSCPSIEPVAIDLKGRNEIEYASLFRHGIHYSHMTHKQLDYISNDYCATSGVLYAPLEVLQHAAWQIEQFKQRLPLALTPRTGHMLSLLGNEALSHGNGPLAVQVPTQLVTMDGQADIGFATMINPDLDPNTPNLGLQPFYLIPTDDTSRINDRAPHPDASPSSSLNEPSTPPKSDSPLRRGPDAFFGLATERRSGVRGGPLRGVLPDGSADLSSRWVEYAPLRVSAEFWGVTALRDKARLYSNTFFYAGSFYNLYLQRLQKKGGHQLGIYLHRQNSTERFPSPSSPPTRFQNSSPYNEIASVKILSTSSSVLAPYTDKRKHISAFFSLWCPNQLGSSLTKFTSGPDSFALSQSWGWKSTSLSSEYLGQTPVEATQSEVNQAGPYSSLRVTIIMGVI